MNIRLKRNHKQEIHNVLEAILEMETVIKKGWRKQKRDAHIFYADDQWEEVPEETWENVTEEFTVSEDKEEWDRPRAVLTHSTHYTMCLAEGYEWRKEEAYVIPFASVLDDRFRYRGREIKQEFERYRVPVLRIMRRRD